MSNKFNITFIVILHFQYTNTDNSVEKKVLEEKGKGCRRKKNYVT